MNPSDITLDTPLAEPAFILGLTAAIVVLYFYTSALSYPEFVALTRVKHYVSLIIAPIASKRGLEIVATKPYRGKEFVTTVDATPREVSQKLEAYGFDKHLIAGSKRRQTKDGKQWAHTQWAYQHKDTQQTEVFIFPNGDNTTDIYAHVETSVYDPEGHLEDYQELGDTRGAFRKAWNN